MRLKKTTLKLLCLVALALPPGLFCDSVLFNVLYTDADGQGFYDPTLGTARQTAFQYACGIWSSYLGTSYISETINISASFASMGGSSSSATLGSAGPTSISQLYFGPSVGNLWANAANANHLVGYDIGGDVEMSAHFNSDVDNDTVLGATDFYYGLDGNCGGNIDFVSVLLHEIGHGLGFTSLIATNGAFAYSGIPGIYDYFLGMDNGDGTFTALADMNDAERLAAITSENLFWLGDHATAANGGDYVKIYAPGIWEQGSSIAHEDETLHPGALMSPYYSGVLHAPDSLTLGILSDIGWTVVPEPSTAMMSVFVCVIAFWIRRRFCD